VMSVVCVHTGCEGACCVEHEPTVLGSQVGGGGDSTSVPTGSTTGAPAPTAWSSRRSLARHWAAARCMSSLHHIARSRELPPTCAAASALEHFSAGASMTPARRPLLHCSPTWTSAARWEGVDSWHARPGTRLGTEDFCANIIENCRSRGENRTWYLPLSMRMDDCMV
jgi:hypothetical protein